MSFQVVTGAMMTCSFGAAPATFVAAPGQTVMAGSLPAGTTFDYVPMLNIPTFGTCMSLANPTVAAATAAALGALTPMPCIPMTVAPWAPGSATILIGGKPALHDGCLTTCAYGGAIQFSMAGQFTVMVS